MSDSSQPSPFTRPGFIAAAIVVLLIVVAGGIAVVIGLASQGEPDPTPTGTTSPAPSADDESVCGLEGFETESTLTEAPDNEWELVGTVAAPTDPAVGPGVVESDGFRSCFAHTAEGALYAAVNFAALGTDGGTQPRLVELVAPGPGRDVLEAQASTGEPSSFRAQVAGFAIHNYSADSVTVDLAVNYATGDLVSLPLKLEWAEGDWKVVVTDDGTFPLAPSEIASLGGYIPWAGA